MSTIEDTTTELVHLTNDQLLGCLTSAHQDFERHQSRFLMAVGHFELRGLAADAGAPSTSQFLIRRLNIAPNTAYEYIRVSETLLGFPFVAEAFAHGQISYSQVRLLRRYLKPDNEVDLVMMAAEMSYRELERALALRFPNDEDDSPPTEDRFRIWVDNETGRVRLSGDLSPSTAAKLFAALKVGELANHVDLSELDEDILNDEEKLNEALDEAEATEDVGAGESDADEGPSRPSGYGRTPSAKMMSALLGLINIALSAPVNSRRAPGAQVHMIHTEDGHSFLPGLPRPNELAATAAIINGQLRGHLLDNRGNPLKMGRTRRLVSDSQALALLARWMFQCATPGCVHSQFMEFHHLHEWSAGGLTDPPNLIPLCGACHSLVTNRLLEIETDTLDPSKLHFRFRTGEHYISHHRGMALRAGVGKSRFDEPLPEPPLRGVDFGTDGNQWAYFGD